MKISVVLCSFVIFFVFSNPLYAKDLDKILALYRQVIVSAPQNIHEADSLNREFKQLLKDLNPPHDSLLAKADFLDAILSLYKDKYFLAEKFFREAISKASGERANILKENCYNNLGVIYFKRNQLNQSLEAYLKSIRLAELRKDSASVVQSWINISLIEYKRKKIERAIEIGEEVLETSERFGDTLNMALSHQNLGIFYYAREAFSKADEHNQKALDLYSKIGFVYDKISLQLNIALALIDRKQYSEAEQLIVRTIPEIEQSGYEGLMVNANLLRGMIYMEAFRQYDTAERYFRAAERLSKQNGKREEQVLIYENLAKLGMNTNRKELIYEALSQFKIFHEQLFEDESNAAYKEIKVLYELDKQKARQLKLRAEMQIRNKQLTFTTILLILIIAASAGMLYQHLRLRHAYSTLFRLNLDQIYSGAQIFPQKNLQHPSNQEITTNDEAQDTHQEFQRLLDLFNQEQLYRDSDLEIQGMASRMKVSVKELNRLIREHSGTNFPGLLNKLRIQAARQMILEDPQQASLKEIAFAVGFSNRVSFYRQFKEETGFAPSEFRELAMKNSIQGDAPFLEE